MNSYPPQDAFKFADLSSVVDRMSDTHKTSKQISIAHYEPLCSYM